MTDDEQAPAMTMTIERALQVLVVALLGAGGWLGKGAYEDLRAELVQQRIEMAETRKVIEGMARDSGQNRSDVAALRERVEALNDRVTRLEAAH